jgi:hypothetical protein
MGHAIAAVLLGMRLEEFSLGEGKRSFEFSVRGVRFHIAPRVNRGHVRVNLPTGRAAILRYAAMVAAGPIANAAMAVIVFLTATGDEWEFQPFSPLGSLWLGWGVANLLCVAYASSRPDVGAEAATPSSDGSKLSMLVRAPREFMNLWRLQNRTAEALRRGEPVEKSRCGGIAAVAQVLAEERAQCLDALIAHKRVRYSERLALIDHFCTEVLFRGDRGRYARALELAEKLFAGRGREFTVQGTYGSILALVDRRGEAAKLLTIVVEKSTSKLDQAISEAVLAWIEHGEGHAAEAARWTALACEANGGPFPISWMATEMGLSSAAPVA